VLLEVPLEVGIRAVQSRVDRRVDQKAGHKVDRNKLELDDCKDCEEDKGMQGMAVRLRQELEFGEFGGQQWYPEQRSQWRQQQQEQQPLGRQQLAVQEGSPWEDSSCIDRRSCRPMVGFGVLHRVHWEFHDKKNNCNLSVQWCQWMVR